LKSNGLISKLSLLDWHRLLQNMIEPIDIKSPIPNSIADAAIEILMDIKKSGLTPDPYIYSCLYKAMSDDVSKILSIHSHARQLKLMNNKMTQTLLQVLVEKHPAYNIKNLILELWLDLKTSKHTITSKTCVAFLSAKQIVEHPNLVLEIHAYLKGRKVNVANEKWDVHLYERLMKIHTYLGNFSAVEKLFIELERDLPTVSRYCFRFAQLVEHLFYISFVLYKKEIFTL
jgi:hypothetical protein